MLRCLNKSKQIPKKVLGHNSDGLGSCVAWWKLHVVEFCSANIVIKLELNGVMHYPVKYERVLVCLFVWLGQVYVWQGLAYAC